MSFYSIFRLLKSLLVLARKLLQGREWYIIGTRKKTYSKVGAKLWTKKHKFFVEIGGITLKGGGGEC